MSDFLNKYPYTDFHELNLDWVIERIKQLTDDWVSTLEDWQTTQEAWTATEEAWLDFRDYVENYLNSLDVQDEIDVKINSMISDGTFALIAKPIIEPKVVSTTTDWLAEHITQPTDPAVDSSLTISGAAADAKVTGDKINEINAAINKEYINLFDKTDIVENKKFKSSTNHTFNNQIEDSSNTDVTNVIDVSPNTYYIITDVINGYPIDFSTYTMKIVEFNSEGSSTNIISGVRLFKTSATTTQIAFLLLRNMSPYDSLMLTNTSNYIDRYYDSDFVDINDYNNNINANRLSLDYEELNLDGRYGFVQGYVTNYNVTSLSYVVHFSDQMNFPHIMIQHDPGYYVQPIYYDEYGDFVCNGSAILSNCVFKPAYPWYWLNIVALDNSESLTPSNVIANSKLKIMVPKETHYNVTAYDRIELTRSMFNNRYLRIPSICVMNNMKTLVTFQSRAQNGDESDAFIQWLIINNGEIESTGAFENDVDVQQVSHSCLCNYNGTVYRFFDEIVYVNSVGYSRICMETSDDFGETWSEKTVLYNTTDLIDSKHVLLSPANCVVYNDNIIIPAYLQGEIPLYAAVNMRSGVIIYNTTNETTIAKFCNIEYTNECCAFMNGSTIILSCRNESQRLSDRAMLTTDLTADGAFTNHTHFLPQAKRVRCEESVLKLNNYLLNSRVSKTESTSSRRSDATLFISTDIGRRYYKGMLLNQYHQLSGCYTAMSCYDNKLACAVESGTNYGYAITIMNLAFTEDLTTDFNKVIIE